MGASNNSESAEIEAVISGRSSKDNSPSLSWFYGEKIRADPDVAKRIDERMLYRWEAYYWVHQSTPREEEKAKEWLKVRAPAKTSPTQAAELARMAILDARPLPVRPPENVCIPLRNIYLHLEEQHMAACDVEYADGNLQHMAACSIHALMAAAPTREAGMTYGLACSLDKAKAGHHYLPSADLDGTLFGQFLESSQPDPAVRDLIQEYFGYTLLPDTRFSVACFFQGDGENGKSACCEILSAIHRKVASIDLNQTDGFNLEDLIDASLVVCDETPERLEASASNRFKSLVDGKKVKINRKFKEVISTSINAKWVICSNHFLKTVDTSHGFWRRLITIPWNTRIPESRKIHHIERRIIANELEIVLEWALEGLLRLMNRGKFPVEPVSVRDLKDDIRSAADTVRAWVKDIKPVVDARVGSSKKHVYTHYERWCEEAGHPYPVTREKFWERVYSILPGVKETNRQKTERINGKLKRTEIISLAIVDVEDLNATDDGEF